MSFFFLIPDSLLFFLQIFSYTALNIMRMGQKLKLIDLDGSASFSSNEEHAGVKFSSAYVPPEMVYVTADDVCVRSPSLRSNISTRLKGDDHSVVHSSNSNSNMQSPNGKYNNDINNYNHSNYNFHDSNNSNNNINYSNNPLNKKNIECNISNLREKNLFHHTNNHHNNLFLSNYNSVRNSEDGGNDEIKTNSEIDDIPDPVPWQNKNTKPFIRDPYVLKRRGRAESRRFLSRRNSLVRFNDLKNEEKNDFDFDLVLAHPSQDLWALGALLFFMAVNAPLFYRYVIYFSFYCFLPLLSFFLFFSFLTLFFRSIFFDCFLSSYLSFCLSMFPFYSLLSYSSLFLTFFLS